MTRPRPRSPAKLRRMLCVAPLKRAVRGTAEAGRPYVLQLRFERYSGRVTTYLKGGQATVIPHLECVYKLANGKSTAYFGYKNNNGVRVRVPYDANKNALALDVQNKRTSLFTPGNQHYQFGIDFTPGQTVTWKLSPTNSPTTVISATSGSPSCVDNNQFKCLRSCQATAASACATDFGIDFDYCMQECMFLYDYFIPISCDTQWSTYLQRSGATASAATNWDCGGTNYDEPIAAACSTQFSAAMTCAGF